MEKSPPKPKKKKGLEVMKNSMKKLVKKIKTPGGNKSTVPSTSRGKYSKAKLGDDEKSKHHINAKTKKTKERRRVRKGMTFENEIGVGKIGHKKDNDGNTHHRHKDESDSKAGRTRKADAVTLSNHRRGRHVKRSRTKKVHKSRSRSYHNRASSLPQTSSITESSQAESMSETSTSTTEDERESSLRIQGELSVQERAALSRMFFRALKLILITGRFIGRFPYRYRLTHAGFLEFDGSIMQGYMIGFLIVNTLFTILFIMGIWTSYALWLAVPIGPDFFPGRRAAKIAELKKVPRFEEYLGVNKSTSAHKLDSEIWAWYLRNRYERYILNRHIIFFLMDWCYLLHNIVSGWYFFLYRHTVVNYFNFWARAIVVLDMDITSGVLRNVLIVSGTYGVLIVILTFLSFFKTLASTSGVPAVLGIILGRNFRADLIGHWPGTVQVKPELQFLIHVSQFLNIYLFLTSKFYIILLIFCAKCLRNGFDRWNGRCYTNTLRAGSNYTPSESRQVYESLYKDHTTLLDLVEGTDNVFAFITESYFGLQTMSLCFEFYFILQSAKNVDALTEDRNHSFEREHDWIAGVMVFATHVLCLAIVLRVCASVREEAMSGLEIIRRKTMVGRRSDDELLFAMSMLNSYTAFNPIAVAAGGFFICDKSLMVGILETILSYFTVIYQFEPKLDFNRESGDPERDCIKAVIQTIEFGAAQPPKHLLGGAANYKPCMVY